MGPFRTCITEALEKGEIDEDTAELATETYDDAYAVASETFGSVEADRRAAAATLRKLEAEKIEARRRREMMIRERKTLLRDMETFKRLRRYEGMAKLGPGGGGRPPKGGWVQGGNPPPEGPYSNGAVAAAFLELKVENKGMLSGAPGASAAGRHRAIVGQAHAIMADVITTFETKTGLDAPRRAQLDNMVREAFGEDSGDGTAKGFAQAWAETAEWLRLRFNAAGGAIGKMENWGLPQMHDAIAIRAAGREGWVKAVMPRLNRSKMIDRMTGQPFTDRRLEAVLGEVWDSIVSRGASRRLPGERLGQGMLAKRRGEERFLIFNSADDWLAYQRDFGEGDAFQAMLGHIDSMAVDLGQMEIFGPNPQAQFDWLSNFAVREAALEETRGVKGARDKALRTVENAQIMLDHLTGAANVAYRPTVSQIGATTRAVLTGVQMGSAILGEVPSGMYFGRMARGFVGLDRNGDMGEMVRLMLDPKARAVARRSGFIIEQATDGFVRGHQDHLRLMSAGGGDRQTGGLNALARRLPPATLRLSGLTGFVSAKKRTYRFERMGQLDFIRDRTLRDLAQGTPDERSLADWMEARGFTEADWGVIRSTPAWEPRPGARFIRPMDVASDDLAMRLAEAIEMDTRFLTPETTLWARAKLVGANRPGSRVGETRRSVSMFGGFSVSSTHLYAEELALRSFRQGGGQVKGMLGFAAVYAAQAVIFLTIAGAVNIQLREIIKGRDPRPMNDVKFWGAALLQGGGLGIFGDFLYAAQARNGKSAEVTAAGPVGSLLFDVGNLTWGNAVEIINAVDEGDSVEEAIEKANVGRDAAGIVRNYNPLATNWWTRAAYSRVVADTVQRALDPEAEEAFERQRKRLERETRQGEWWATGEIAPSRGPDLSNVNRPKEP